MDENNPSPAEVPTPEVPAENPTPATEVPVSAAPPAAALVINGTKSEREIQLERDLEKERDRAKRAEIVAAEKEREVQELKKIPAVPKPKKEKSWYMPVIGGED